MHTQYKPDYEKARIVIVDDHPIFLMGLRELINIDPGLTVCGEADNYSDALKVIGSLDPDIVIADIFLQDRDRLDLVKTIKERHPHIRVIVVSMYDENTYVERALAYGASGYIVKQEAPSSVVGAIKSVLKGEIAVGEPFRSQLLQKYVAAGRSELPQRDIDLMSEREIEIFQLIGQGNATQEIAEMLNVSAKTINTHRQNIKEKLGLKNSTVLIQRAFQFANQGRHPSEI
jgi:DNA-binding NarL/FixJ family response regulator